MEDLDELEDIKTQNARNASVDPDAVMDMVAKRKRVGCGLSLFQFY